MGQRMSKVPQFLPQWVSFQHVSATEIEDFSGFIEGFPCIIMYPMGDDGSIQSKWEGFTSRTSAIYSIHFPKWESRPEGLKVLNPENHPPNTASEGNWDSKNGSGAVVLKELLFHIPKSSKSSKRLSIETTMVTTGIPHFRTLPVI